KSTRVFVEGSRGVRVPMREIALSGGEAPLRVYDTSGPRVGVDVRRGLPPVRADWIAARGDVAEEPLREARSRGAAVIPEGLLRRPVRSASGAAVTQLAYARRGEITGEMEFVALREG